MAELVKDTTATANKTVPKFDRSTPLTPARLNAVFQPLLNSTGGGDPILSKRYHSGDVTPLLVQKRYPVGGSGVYHQQEFAHGLGAVPKFMQVRAKVRNVARGSGHSVGDVYPVLFSGDVNRTAGHGVQVYADDTNITINTNAFTNVYLPARNKATSYDGQVTKYYSYNPTSMYWLVDAWV